MLGYLYPRGSRKEHYDDESYEQAIHCFETAAKQDDPDGMCWLGWCYEHGKGVKANAEKALDLYEKSASRDSNFANIRLQKFPSDADACFRFGKKCFEAKKYGTAVIAFHKASGQNNIADALYMLGQCFEKGHGVPEDEARAAKYYLQAAEVNVPDAQFAISRCYKNGIGVEKVDMMQSLKWFTKAAKNGNIEAKKRMNELFSLFIAIIALFFGIVFCAWGGAKLLEFILSLYGIVI